MHKFFERYKKLGENEITEEEINAGIENFDKFGFFNVVYSLANGDVTKFDNILLLPAETIYMTLIYEKEKRKYEKELAAIYKRQQAPIK